MLRKLTILLVILISVPSLLADEKTETVLKQKYKPLRDGFAIEGIDGKLIEEGNNNWLFVLESDLRDDQGLIPAGTEVEILLSTALEKVIASIDANSSKNYRIWGNVTRYENENFIFLIYSLPISTVKESNVEPNEGRVKPAVNEPNDELLMPEEIVQKLRVRKVIQIEQLNNKSFELKQDYILANKSGYIVPQADGKYVFTLDAMGQNIQNISIPLLKCQTLEKAVEKQKTEFEKTRLKVSGIITQFKGQKHLLLQQATVAYSYGNLGR